MKPKIRLFRRGGVFWSHDSETGRQQSLRTKIRNEAKRLIHGRNEPRRILTCTHSNGGHWMNW